MKFLASLSIKTATSTLSSLKSVIFGKIYSMIPGSNPVPDYFFISIVVFKGVSKNGAQLGTYPGSIVSLTK